MGSDIHHTHECRGVGCPSQVGQVLEHCLCGEAPILVSAFAYQIYGCAIAFRPLLACRLLKSTGAVIDWPMIHASSSDVLLNTAFKEVVSYDDFHMKASPAAHLSSGMGSA